MKKINLKIEGMRCKSCEIVIADVLEEVGIKNSKIDSNKGTAEIEFDETKISVNKVKEAIKKEGYNVKS